MDIKSIAESIENADTISMTYEREVKVKKECPFSISKKTIINCVYDERNYFNQIMEHNGINLMPVQEEKYKKLSGCLYQKIDTDNLYVRIFSPKSRIERTAQFFREDGKELKYKDIEKYLYANEKQDYTCYNRQTSTGSAGMPIDDEIVVLNFNLEKIISLEKK